MGTFIGDTGLNPLSRRLSIPPETSRTGGGNGRGCLLFLLHLLERRLRRLPNCYRDREQLMMAFQGGQNDITAAKVVYGLVCLGTVLL
eukprot:g18644.t1